MTTTTTRIITIALAILALAAANAWPPALFAQVYPNKPVRVVIGYAPGGSADAGIRAPLILQK